MATRVHWHLGNHGLVLGNKNKNDGEPRNYGENPAIGMHMVRRSRGSVVNAPTGASRYLLLSAAVGLAAVLLVFALWTYRELAEMQRIYLHDRASMIADQLETFPVEQLAQPLEIPL